MRNLKIYFVQKLFRLKEEEAHKVKQDHPVRFSQEQEEAVQVAQDQEAQVVQAVEAEAQDQAHKIQEWEGVDQEVPVDQAWVEEDQDLVEWADQEDRVDLENEEGK